MTFIWGLPDWVALALACYVGVAILNCAAWLLTEMPEVESKEEPSGPPSPRLRETRDGTP